MVNTSSCVKPCSGLIVTGFTKYEVTKDNLEAIKMVLSSVFDDYNRYKKVGNVPDFGKN